MTLQKTRDLFPDLFKISKKSSVQEFADTLTGNPKEAIAWAKSEIKEFEKLIKLIKKLEKKLWPNG